VAEAARRETEEVRANPDAWVMAADVGGTYARIGLVRVGANGAEVSHFQKYRCAEYPSLAAVFKNFIAAAGTIKITRGAIACAGVAIDDAIINTNLPWPVSQSEIRNALGLDDLLLVNDFTAIAYATTFVTARDVTPIVASSEPLEGPVLVVGPGTGLGAAVRIPGARSPVILSTEAGQSSLTASSEIELQVLRHLLRDNKHVPLEQILSGPGLANLHAALCALRGIARAQLTPKDIAEAALAGNDAIAVETLRVFCGWFGSVVGDLVLLYGAQGGVFLAGGILPQIKDFLLRSDFVARYRDKGAMRGILERVPVSLIEHGQLGVLGAARWYVDQRST
jgi:glucokinase